MSLMVCDNFLRLPGQVSGTMEGVDQNAAAMLLPAINAPFPSTGFNDLTPGSDAQPAAGAGGGPSSAAPAAGAGGGPSSAAPAAGAGGGPSRAAPAPGAEGGQRDDGDKAEAQGEQQGGSAVDKKHKKS